MFQIPILQHFRFALERYFACFLWDEFVAFFSSPKENYKFSLNDMKSKRSLLDIVGLESDFP